MGGYEVRKGMVILVGLMKTNYLTYDLSKLKETSLSMEKLTSESLIRILTQTTFWYQS